jgi:hypothetical protein
LSQACCKATVRFLPTTARLRKLVVSAADNDVVPRALLSAFWQNGSLFFDLSLASLEEGEEDGLAQSQVGYIQDTGHIGEE